MNGSLASGVAGLYRMKNTITVDELPEVAKEVQNIATESINFVTDKMSLEYQFTDEEAMKLAKDINEIFLKNLRFMDL